MLAWFCERNYAWAKRPLMSKISRLAAENGVLVGGLESHSRSLEDYYMHIKEGGKNA